MTRIISLSVALVIVKCYLCRQSFYITLCYVSSSYVTLTCIPPVKLFLCRSHWVIVVIIIGCLTSTSFFVLYTAACSFPQTIATMISKIAVAALFCIKEAGGTKVVIGQTSTDCITEASTILMRTASTGTRFEDIIIH